MWVLFEICNAIYKCITGEEICKQDQQEPSQENVDENSTDPCADPVHHRAQIPMSGESVTVYPPTQPVLVQPVPMDTDTQLPLPGFLPPPPDYNNST